MTSRALVTSNELYPIKDNPEATDTIRLILDNCDRDLVGHIVLRAPLSHDQKKIIAARRSELEAGLIRARQRDIEDEVLKLINGFDQYMDAKEAAAIVAQYTSVLIDAGYPIFAIRRACLRFSTGSVTEEELDLRDGQRYRRGKCPPVDFLCIVARKIVQKFRNEFACANAILIAPVGKTVEVSPEERERVAGLLRQTAEQLKATDTRLTRESEERRAANEKWKRDAAESHMLRQYEALGLPPVRNNGILQSLELLEHQGWKLETKGKKHFLVTPQGKRYQPEETA